MALTIFLPVRKGSERITEKNTRKFASFKGGLLELKLWQLIKVKNADEIVVSTNDERCMEIARSFLHYNVNLRIVERPDELGSSETNLCALIRYVPEIVSSDEILWTHVTSPFCDAKTYLQTIATYNSAKTKGCDSLITGSLYQQFLMDQKSGKIVNNFCSELKWPRTQDLAKWFEINNAVFIAPKSRYLEGDRVGENPFLMELNKINSLDIDNEEDFKIAQAVYEGIYK